MSEEIEVKVIEVKKVKPGILHLHLKVRDEFTATLYTDDGVIIKGQDEGYVPDFMPDDHYGDYVILDIDVLTGQIKNWNVDLGLLQEWVNKNDEDY